MMADGEQVSLYLGDCLEVLRTLPAGSVDAVITDPPYGIGKAEWDTRFSLEWAAEAARVSKHRLVIMPGTWNLVKCPQQIGDMSYKWTLSAHLINGMTRGALGFGNWIPAVVYERKISSAEVAAWCSAFADWCDTRGISRVDLNRVTGTSDMGGWWASRLPHRSQVPSPAQWDKLRAAFNPPAYFNDLVAPSDYRLIGDCKGFTVGGDDKPEHPSPKPLNVMVWIVESLSAPGATVLDPFMGSGTTGVACVQTGRRFVGVEISEEYFRIAQRRIAEAQAQPHLIAPGDVEPNGKAAQGALYD